MGFPRERFYINVITRQITSCSRSHKALYRDSDWKFIDVNETYNAKVEYDEEKRLLKVTSGRKSSVVQLTEEEHIRWKGYVKIFNSLILPTYDKYRIVEGDSFYRCDYILLTKPKIMLSCTSNLINPKTNKEEKEYFVKKYIEKNKLKGRLVRVEGHISIKKLLIKKLGRKKYKRVEGLLPSYLMNILIPIVKGKPVKFNFADVVASKNTWQIVTVNGYFLLLLIQNNITRKEFVEMYKEHFKVPFGFIKILFGEKGTRKFKIIGEI